MKPLTIKQVETKLQAALKTIEATNARTMTGKVKVYAEAAALNLKKALEAVGELQ